MYLPIYYLQIFFNFINVYTYIHVVKKYKGGFELQQNNYHRYSSFK